uniref:Uncharacterized protein n=1 Tax=Acrobeloides nanus TaxID=290746 RepID=A0A914DXI6_9BILA
MRPAAMILFAAGADMSQYKVVQDLSGYISDWSGTLIGVNFNSANQNLTNILNMATYNNLVNASMYNYLSTRNTLTKDLEWAILQG